jgi:2'-5' RNA ligase
MKTETLNIAILPSEKIIEQAIKMSQKVSDEVGSRFTLKQKTLIPHITVYQAQYPSKNIDRLKNIVEDFALKTELFDIKLNQIAVSHGTFLFWNCEKSPILQDLHEKVVKLANPLREGLVPSQLADRENLSPGDEYDIKTFGAMLIGPRYKPHITIARLSKDNDVQNAVRVLDGSKEESFKPRALFLGYLGEHGTVVKIIKKYRFS